MNGHSAGYTALPRTAYLENTLRRARTAAEQRSHRYVTPEHLLLALADDPDAVHLLKAAGADVAAIRAAIADIVNHRMAALAVPDGRPPSFSYKFDTLFLSASEVALRAGRREVDGALALIAVAKDPESNASAILEANGFHWQTALHSLNATAHRHHAEAGVARRPEPASPQMRPAQPGAPAAPIQTPRASASDRLMQDMLASVRNILNAEERKERGLPPVNGPAPPQVPWPEPSGPLQREPRFSAGTGQEPAGYPARVEPPAGPVYSPQDKKRKGRGRGEPPAALAKLLQNLPRKAHIGASETVRLQLAKEEAGFLLARAARRGQPQLAPGGHAICWAVTVRLTAPEGGFFIEASAPETQWIFDRASFPGEGDFGSWEWTAVAGEAGSFILALSISAREMDGSGGFEDLQLPDQFVKVRIRGSFWRALWGLVRTVLLLAAGSGLTVGAWYALKIMGKLPH